MTYDQALAFIHRQETFGIQLGLSRMEYLLEALDHPEQKLRFVHVAGTNGKGTATTMTAACLTAAGYRTGLYTSPYIVDFRERIRIDGGMIPQDDLAAAVERMVPLCAALESRGTPVTEFEMITALALRYFYDQGCDIVCLEVGLGGRFDATNAIGAPLVSVIMNLGLDHTDILGDTLEKIAFEKAGIVKRGGTTVCYPGLPEEALAVIRQRANEEGNPLVIPDLAAVTHHTQSLSGQSFCYKGLDIGLSLLGSHQVSNTVTVIEVIGALRGQGYAISDEAMLRGIRDTRIPARLEQIGTRPLCLLDGAHNPQGAAVLRDAIKALASGRVVAVCGMLGDKNYTEALSLVLPLCHSCITVTPQSPRALSAEALCNTARAYCADCSWEDDYSTAIDKAVRQAGEGGVVVVFGSLYLSSAIRPLLLQRLGDTEKM